VDEDGQSKPTAKAPRGMYPGKLDEKGRVKVPAAFQPYLTAKRLFVTSLDRRIAAIYPMELWEQNEKFFEGYREDPELAEMAWFNASDLGSEAEMDSQGRITFSAELRRALKIENAQVKLLGMNNGRIDVLTEEEYEARLRASLERFGKAEKHKLEAAGLA
jgi:MraZ protein